MMQILQACIIIVLDPNLNLEICTNSSATCMESLQDLPSISSNLSQLTYLQQYKPYCSNPNPIPYPLPNGPLIYIVFSKSYKCLPGPELSDTCMCYRHYGIMQTICYYPYSKKFSRGSIFTDGRSLPFYGFYFRGYTHSCRYNQACFARLISWLVNHP